MRKRRGTMAVALMATFGFGILGSHAAFAAGEDVGKRAILVVSFGTTFADTRKLTTEAVRDEIKAAFPGYEVREAFTSRIIIKKLADRDGLKYDTEKQALDRLQVDGYTNVVIQPLHIEAGEEYEKLAKAVSGYEGKFSKLVIGRPLLYYTGQEGQKPDDYQIAIKAIQDQLPKLGPSDAVALMGHGGVNPANAAYAALQLKIQDASLKNVFVFTVEGYPTLDNLKDTLRKNKIKKVILMPIMLVAGDHANNDMAGEDDESFKSQLVKAGFKVDTYIRGLGENKAIQDIYIQHVKDAIEGKYAGRGADRPMIPVID
jgi:sirohydrochlorin cobaltochelatase